MSKVRGSEIVKGIERHRKLVEQPFLERSLEIRLSNAHCDTLQKMAETRHVLVEKDFTKQKEDES